MNEYKREIEQDQFGRPYVLGKSPISGQEIRMAVSDEDLERYEKYDCKVCENVVGGCTNCGSGFRVIEKS